MVGAVGPELWKTEMMKNELMRRCALVLSTVLSR